MTPSVLTADLVNSVPLPTMATRAQFIAWLKFLHGIVRASGPLLELAVQKSQGALRDYYASHLAEEKDHADWLAEDMSLLGEAPALIDHATAATAGAQYYYLQHVGPHALLGYMAALEFRAPSIATIEALEKVFGAPALRTLRHHAEHDPEHAKELASVIDAHEKFADIVCYSAFVTAKMFAFYLEERIRHA
jgi:hypothetical protein